MSLQPADFTLRFPAPYEVWSINRQTSVNRFKRAEFRRFWRDATRIWALGARNEGRLPRFKEPCTIRCTLPVKSVLTRRDAANYTATTKPIIDGILDAKIFPDDSAEWLQELPILFVKIPELVKIEIWRGFIL